MAQTEQRESPAGSLHDHSKDIRVKTISERVQECGFLCEKRELECESKAEDTAVCKELKHEEIHHQAAEELDPRIQEELERLNVASEEINQLELQLEEERSNYRKNLSESANRIYALSSQLGSCIEKARPYHEARRLAKEAQQETQKAALSYERAVSMHAAAREMVYVAEQGFGVDKAVDQTWQEMLNHATVKVNEAEEERLRSEREHMRVTQQCQAAEAEVQSLQKSLKRIILKSKPYFELKAQLHSILEEHKLKVDQLEEHVIEAKKRYSLTLQSLEKISEEIHAQREHEHSEDGSTKSFGARSSPVGAETVGGTGTEGRTGDILHKAKNWVEGHDAQAKDWAETHRKSGWWENAQKGADVAVASDHSSVFTELERCDTVEHMGQPTIGEKMEKMEDAEGRTVVECSEEELVKENVEELTTNNPQTEILHESWD